MVTSAKDLYDRIVAALRAAGRDTPYAADANEPDPRYKGYGVRAPAMKQLIREHKAELDGLSREARLAMARRLIESGYGEQKTVALHLLDSIASYFEPARFDELDHLVRQLHGWSKIDAYTGTLLRRILETHPEQLLTLVTAWNADEDLWLRRASVVLFTRRVARSGQFLNTALALCENLKRDPEDLVRKGVGWCLKDHMVVDKQRLLDYVIELRRQQVSSTITLYALRGLPASERAAVLARS